jgi:hypothetical protein
VGLGKVLMKRRRESNLLVSFTACNIMSCWRLNLRFRSSYYTYWMGEGRATAFPLLQIHHRHSPSHSPPLRTISSTSITALSPSISSKFTLYTCVFVITINASVTAFVGDGDDRQQYYARHL